MPVNAMAQEFFDGMPRVAYWTDYEDQPNEMPAKVWGNCDVEQSDHVGIIVDFAGFSGRCQ